MKMEIETKLLWLVIIMFVVLTIFFIVHSIILSNKKKQVESVKNIGIALHYIIDVDKEIRNAKQRNANLQKNRWHEISYDKAKIRTANYQRTSTKIRSFPRGQNNRTLRKR